jgi:hypothetical protein
MYLTKGNSPGGPSNHQEEIEKEKHSKHQASRYQGQQLGWYKEYKKLTRVGGMQ